MDFKFPYDPTLLHISACATFASALPGDWANTPIMLSPASWSSRHPGDAAIRLERAAGADQCRCAATAPYGPLKCCGCKWSGRVQSGLTVVPAAATGDFAIHKNIYLGDVDGSGIYTGFDVALISRVVVGLDSGFDAASSTVH